LSTHAKQDYFATLFHIHQWTLAASKPHPDTRDLPPWETQPDALWHLLLHLDSWLFGPATPDEPKAPGDLLASRLKTLRLGRIHILHARSSLQLVRPSTTPTHFSSDDDPCPQAQRQADCDNYRTAYQRIQSALPIAPMTPHNKAIAQGLYPPRPPNPFNTPLTPRTNPATPPITTQLVATALAKLKTGTAFGPFLDLTDTLKEYALHTRNVASPTPSQPYLATMTAILRLVIHNQVPPPVTQHLRACRFLALHKDPDDLNKLRPIGIGSAYRRLASTVLVSLYNPLFAALFTQHGQMAVAVSGGIDFLTHLAQADLDHHILAPISNGSHPSRAALALDLRNFFNEVSRSAIRHALHKHQQFTALLPYFDLMYDQPNRCYFAAPDGQLDFLTQHDGVPQGDPLSTALAALALHEFLSQYSTAQAQRAAARLSHRNPGDDGLGSVAPPHQYIDDGLYFLPYEDLAWFIDFVQTHGPPHGIHLNPTKTKILTTATHQIAHDLLSPAQRQHLQDALTLLSGESSESHDGLTLLGQPLGSHDFSAAFLQTKATKFAAATNRLHSRLSDPQTIASLHKCCSVPAMAHLLAADVLHNTELDNPNAPPPTLDGWLSPFTTNISHTTNSLFLSLSGHDGPLPALATLILHHPVAKGGLGIRDHSLAAIPSFLAPLARSIQYATTGIPQGELPPIRLPRAYTNHLTSWRTARHPPRIIRVFKHYCPALIAKYNTIHPSHPITDNTLARLASLRGLQAALYAEAHTQRFLRSAPQLDDEDILPSLLSPLTAIPLHSLARRHPHTRLDADQYRILLRRKLRLPIFPHTQPNCPLCSKALDPYGDRLLSCAFSKQRLHNHMRNALHTVLRTVGPLAAVVASPDDITLEPDNLIPSAPRKRPADIAINLRTPTPNHTRTIAIDITIPPIHVPPSRRLPHSTQPKTLTEAHRRSIRGKFIGRNSDTHTLISELNSHHTAILPFTIDHLGGLGTFSHALLFAEHHAPMPPPPPISIGSFVHPASTQAYVTAHALRPAILSTADAHWKQLHTVGRFGSTFRTRTPQQWALQVLALNFAHASSTHLLAAQRRCTTQATVRPTVRGILPNFLPAVPTYTLGTTRTIHTFLV
jgi:hypothetical protein